MKQYKTVAGPIELTAQTGQHYENVVKIFARIIDKEAVGGWSLHLIQQIAVKKLVYFTAIIGAIVGAVAGVIFMESAIGFFIGLLLGGGLGCLGLKYNVEYFNMLVFVKDDGSTGIDTPLDIPSQIPIGDPSQKSVSSQVNQPVRQSAEFWVCKNCDTTNNSINAYCKNCPTKKTINDFSKDNKNKWTCKNCNTRNDSTDTYCKNCFS
ncbi:MAG: hypothetical protein LBC71_06040 [Oscillospiraceae bacterium]|jgi:hypothetical protein|nr:hypothetical protein [Oscillospiraceae bacterium]